MQHYLFIIMFVYVAFILEGTLAQLFGNWFNPNILIIIIVFFNLFRGIRYSLFTAIIAGLFKDSYSVGPFGMHIFAFLCCAYLTTLFKMYVYHPGSHASRVLMVFIISVCNVLLLYTLNIMFTPIGFRQVFSAVLVPEVLITAFVTPYVFDKFRSCASRLFA